MSVVATTPLQEQVEKEVKKYFRTLNGEKPAELHDLVIGQVFRPRFCAERVPWWLVLGVVEKQHHVMVKAHRRDVSSQFEQDRHPAGSVVGAWHGLRAIAFVFILVGHASRVGVG